jgi:hypothetical protein
MPIDLHFWVEKDGKIIDNTIIELVLKLKMLGARKLVYLYYPDVVSNVIVEDEKNICKFKCGFSGKTWEQKLEEGRNGANNKTFSCVSSSICYAHWNGGEVKVGCLGYIDWFNDKIHWLFGHPDNEYAEYNRSDGDDVLNDRQTLALEHEERIVFIDLQEKEKPKPKKNKITEPKIDLDAIELEKKNKIAEQNERELFAMLEKEEKQKSKPKKNKKSVKKH